MQQPSNTAVLLLRLSLAATFLSAVASRLHFWGSQSSGWKAFLQYTAEVNSFAPAGIIPFLAVAATILETLFALSFIIGFKLRWSGLGAGILTLLFALAMTYSMGIKSPLDYSVFVFSASAFLLSKTNPDKWSLDGFVNRSAH